MFTVSQVCGLAAAPTTGPRPRKVQASPYTLTDTRRSGGLPWTRTIRPIQRFHRPGPRRNHPASNRTDSTGISALMRSPTRKSVRSPFEQGHRAVRAVRSPTRTRTAVHTNPCATRATVPSMTLTSPEGCNESIRSVARIEPSLNIKQDAAAPHPLLRDQKKIWYCTRIRFSISVPPRASSGTVPLCGGSGRLLPMAYPPVPI